MDSLIQPVIRNWCMHACIHSFIHEFINSFVLSCVHSSIRLLIHCFLCCFIRSLVHAFLRSLVHTFMSVRLISLHFMLVRAALCAYCCHSLVPVPTLFQSSFTHPSIHPSIHAYKHEACIRSLAYLIGYSCVLGYLRTIIVFLRRNRRMGIPKNTKQSLGPTAAKNHDLGLCGLGTGTEGRRCFGLGLRGVGFRV